MREAERREYAARFLREAVRRRAAAEREVERAVELAARHGVPAWAIAETTRGTGEEEVRAR